MEKRKRQPNVTRAKILEVAGEDFVRCGYAASGLGGIVERAGLTKGALFHHFEDKRALGLAWLGESAATEMRATWLDPLSKLASLDGLKAFCQDRLKSMSASDALSGLVLMAAEMAGVDEAIAAAVEEVFETWRNGFADVFGRGKEAGWIRCSIRPDVEASFLVSMFCGFSLGMRLSSADATRCAALMALDAYLESLREV